MTATTPAPADDAPVAVGGSPSGDVYLMPSLMTATVLADAGYRTVNLGAQLPLETLRAAARHYGASAVWLACSCADHAPDAGAVHELARALDCSGDTTLLLGGRARPQDLRADHVVQVGSMAELAAFAAGASSAG